MCRWLERDPAGYQDGPSLYSYLGRNPMAGTDPYGQVANILVGAGFGAVFGGVRAAIMGEDILEGAAKGAVVGAVAGATFGAGLAIAGTTTTATIVGSSVAAGIAGAAASALVEGRAPTAEELVVGGVVGLVAPSLGQAVMIAARHALGHLRAAAQAGLQAVRGRRLPQSDTVARPGPGGASGAGQTLSREAEKGISSLQRRIAEHELKLLQFKENPTVRPGMEGLPAELIKRQQETRVRHLEAEIRAFKQNMEKLRRGCDKQ
jgi:hypothetical protein